MRKKLQKKAAAFTTLVKQVRLESILPFTEKPSSEQNSAPGESKKSLDASDLFSLFTADIIKEEVIFTR